MKRVERLVKEYTDIALAGLTGSGIAIKKGVPCLCASLKNCRGCDLAKSDKPCDKALYDWLTEECKNGKDKPSAKAKKEKAKKPTKVLPEQKVKKGKAKKPKPTKKASESLLGQTEMTLTIVMPTAKGKKKSGSKETKGKSANSKGKAKVKGA